MTDTSNLPDPAIEWRRSTGEIPYRDALAEQQARSDALMDGKGQELVWMLEHPPVYTLSLIHI